jgi:hypothetical protein
MHGPSSRPQRCREHDLGADSDVELHDAYGLARAVLDPDILDVDACPSGVGEQRRELPGPVVDHHGDRRVRRRGRAMFSG